MTPDQQPKTHHSAAPQRPTSAHSNHPPKNHFLDDVIGIEIGISVGWLGEIAMQSAGFSLFAFS